MELLKPLIFLSLLLFSLAAVSGTRGPLVGGWEPIEDVKDPHVVEIGQYAVSEYNKQSKGADLRFENVVSGESQVVAGLNYKLVIAAKKGEKGESKKYEAVVWEKAWENFRNLTSFKPSSGEVH